MGEKGKSDPFTARLSDGLPGLPVSSSGDDLARQFARNFVKPFLVVVVIGLDIGGPRPGLGVDFEGKVVILVVLRLVQLVVVIFVCTQLDDIFDFQV